MDSLITVGVVCWISVIVVLLLIGNTPQAFNRYNHKNFVILTALAFPFLVLLLVVDLLYQLTFGVIRYFLNLGVDHEQRGDKKSSI